MCIGLYTLSSRRGYRIAKGVSERCIARLLLTIQELLNCKSFATPLDENPHHQRWLLCTVLIRYSQFDLFQLRKLHRMGCSNRIFDYSIRPLLPCHIFGSPKGQWRIQDFPLGVPRPVGGAPTSDAYTFRWKHMRKQKKLILLGGRAGGAPWIRQWGYIRSRYPCTSIFYRFDWFTDFSTIITFSDGSFTIIFFWLCNRGNTCTQVHDRIDLHIQIWRCSAKCSVTKWAHGFQVGQYLDDLDLYRL